MSLKPEAFIQTKQDVRQTKGKCGQDDYQVTQVPTDGSYQCCMPTLSRSHLVSMRRVQV